MVHYAVNCFAVATHAQAVNVTGREIHLITYALLSVFNKTYWSLWTHNVNIGFEIVSRYKGIKCVYFRAVDRFIKLRYWQR